MRKEVNELDNLTTGKAVDVLLNYETVKLFNNEQLEVDQYDAYLLGFQVTCYCSRPPIAITSFHHKYWLGHATPPPQTPPPTPFPRATTLFRFDGLVVQHATNCLS